APRSAETGRRGQEGARLDRPCRDAFFASAVAPPLRGATPRASARFPGGCPLERTRRRVRETDEPESTPYQVGPPAPRRPVMAARQRYPRCTAAWYRTSGR